MSVFYFRSSMLLLLIAVFPLPWIIHDMGLMAVDAIGIGVSLIISILSLAKIKCTIKGEHNETTVKAL